MKRILAAALLSFMLYSCADTKKQEETLLNEVIAVHDKVMAKDEQIMKNKMKLDTLIKENKKPELTPVATELRTKLDSADAKMENWMHKFDAENKGKKHDEIMTYLTGQKGEIEAIDKNFDASITEASEFLKQNNLK